MLTQVQDALMALDVDSDELKKFRKVVDKYYKTHLRHGGASGETGLNWPETGAATGSETGAATGSKTGAATGGKWIKVWRDGEYRYE